MERSLDVRTGESVALRFELAGAGSRFLAVLVDLAIQLLVVAVIGCIAAFVLSTPAGSALPRQLGKAAHVVVLTTVIVTLFLVFFGYFIGFEWWWSGRTPGKRALRIRAVRDGGFPLDAGSAVIRNAVRIIEAGLGFYALSAICTLISRENKRIGDFAAGTIVIRERALARPTAAAFAEPAERPDDGLDDAQRTLIRRYLARRETLEPQARAQLAAAIAGRVRPHLRASFDYLADDDLLAHVGRETSAPDV